MRRRPIRRLAAVAGSVLAAFAVAGTARAAGSLAVRGEKVYTAAGGVVDDGVVVVRDGKIAAVGPAAAIEIPAGFAVIEAAVVTPGLIDAHTVVGLAGYLNQSHDQDQLERSAAIQPELRALDAYDARERLVEWLRGFGVTTLHTGHGPGALVTGQTMIVKTRGETVDEAVVEPVAMIAATLGEGALVSEEGERRGRDDSRRGPRSPGTRGKAAAMLRSRLVEAREYLDERDRAEEGKAPPRDLALEALGRVLKRELPLLVTVHRHQDIMTALRLRREFGFDLVLDGAAEAYLLVEEIRDAGVPVFVHPTMARARGETENLTMENAARLADAGIPIALQSGFESYVPKTRVVLFEAGAAAAYGLGFDRALAAVTIDAARLLGVDGRVGSIEVGKDGDLALYDGDPFEYTSHCVGTIIEGEVVSEVVR